MRKAREKKKNAKNTKISREFDRYDIPSGY